MDNQMQAIPSVSKWGYTKYDAKSLDFNWEIHNFSLSSLDEEIQSPVFSALDENETKWRLDLQPKKIKANETEEQVSIYLYLVDGKDSNIKVSCTFSIIKNNGSEHSESVIHSYTSKGTGYGFSHFIKYYDLINKGYLSNDTLRITSKIKYSTGKVNYYVQNVPDVNVNMDFDMDLSKDISSIYEDKNFSDVCLEVDGVQFRVHRNILAARSSVFAAMFKNDMKEKKEDVIVIPNIKPEIMKKMLSFIYTGHVTEIKPKAFELLQAADMYDLSNLKLLCENSLSKSFTVNNVANILHIADVHNAKNLKRMAIKFVKDNISHVIQAPNFLDFNESKSCLIDVLKSITLKNADS